MSDLPAAASSSPSAASSSSEEAAVVAAPAAVFATSVGSFRRATVPADPPQRSACPHRRCPLLRRRLAAAPGCGAVRGPPAAGCGAASAAGSCPNRCSTRADTCRSSVPGWSGALATRFRPLFAVFCGNASTDATPIHSKLAASCCCYSGYFLTRIAAMITLRC